MANIYCSSKAYEAITPWGGQQNLLLQSNAFSNAAWTATLATPTQGTDADPFGGTAAWRLTDNSTGGFHCLAQSVTKSAVATRYMFSCYFKIGTVITRIWIGIYGSTARTNGYYMLADLAGGQIGISGTLAGSGWTAGIYKIEPVLGQAGWYRCEISAVTSTEAVVVPCFGLDNGTGTSGGASSYNGSSNYVLIYGAQLEPSLYVCGTYTPTTTAAVAQTVSFSATLNQLVRATDPGIASSAIIATIGIGGERVFKCTTAGTTGSVEPSATNGNPWNLSKNGTTADGTAIWTEITGQESAQVAGTWAPYARIILFQTTFIYISSFSLTAGGTGYAANDIVAVTGGTVYGDYAIIKVLTVSSGAIATFQLLSGGSYSAASGALATTKITGTGTGATFTPTTASTTGIAAGDNVYLGNLHNEWNNAGVSVTFPGTAALPNIISSVDQSASGSIPPTASNMLAGAKIATVAANSLVIGGCSECYGTTLQAGTQGSATVLNVGAGGSGIQRYYNCSLILGGTAAAVLNAPASSSVVYLDNTTVQVSSTTSTIDIVGPLIWRNTANAIQGSITPSTLLTPTASVGYVQLEGLDLTGLGSGKTLFGRNNFGPCQAVRCKLPGSLTVAGAGVPGSNRVELVQCDSGGLVTRNERYWGQGVQTVDTTVVRTGGASDSGTAISWRNSTTATNAFGYPFETQRIAVWNTTTGSTVNVNVFGVTNVSAPNTLTDLWVEVDYFGTAGSTLGTIATQQPANRLTAGVALTADTSAWDSAATARVNSKAYALGNVIATSSNAGRIFICTTAGTSTSTEPGGYASAVDGGTVTDGTAVFTAGYRFKQTIAVTPQIAGLIHVTVKIPKSSATALYWIDPLVTLS